MPVFNAAGLLGNASSSITFDEVIGLGGPPVYFVFLGFFLGVLDTPFLPDEMAQTDDQ